MVGNDILVISGIVLITFMVGSMMTTIACATGMFFTRKAYTNEPLFNKEFEIEENIDDEIDIETREEKESKDHTTLNNFRGAL